MTRFKIHPTAGLALFFPLFGLLTWGQTGLLWGSAILHEAGHIAAYCLWGRGMESITFLPFGLLGVPKNPLEIPPKNEVPCSFAGPFLNLFAALLLLALPLSAESGTVRFLLYGNLALFVLNMLPILPLDGGRILYYGLAIKWDCGLCERVCYRVAVVSLLLLLFPVCLSLFADKNPSLAMVWGYLGVYTLIKRGAV